MEIILQGKKIETEADLHRTLAGQLDFGPYYGANLAALWDRLSRDIERPIQLVWKDAAHSQAAMGDQLFAAVVKLFRDVEQQDREFEWTETFTFTCE